MVVAAYQKKVLEAFLAEACVEMQEKRLDLGARTGPGRDPDFLHTSFG